MVEVNCAAGALLTANARELDGSNRRRRRVRRRRHGASRSRRCDARRRSERAQRSAARSTYGVSCSRQRIRSCPAAEHPRRAGRRHAAPPVANTSLPSCDGSAACRAAARQCVDRTSHAKVPGTHGRTASCRRTAAQGRRGRPAPASGQDDVGVSRASFAVAIRNQNLGTEVTVNEGAGPGCCGGAGGAGARRQSGGVHEHPRVAAQASVDLDGGRDRHLRAAARERSRSGRRMPMV